MPEEGEKTNLMDGKGKRGVTFSLKLEDLEKKIAETEKQDKKEKMDTRRNKEGWDTRKLYEVMLMEEIPEEKRPNVPTYAVLDSEPGKWEVDGDTDSDRNHALLHYLANLANSNNRDDVFNFEFVESLVRNGADINFMDINGQTIFHEVARSWNVDVAMFLVEHGANVNHQDEFGRSPLHVAAAVDYPSMVEFILQHGGNIEIKTKGEEQTAIHYAAKNNAVNSIQMLLGHGANIDARDSRNRTPLQVSAEMNSFKAAKLLVTEGAPAGVYDDHGNSALSLLIDKIPEVALIALDQLHTSDYLNRREFYFLNHLEGAKLKEELQDTTARSPLEIAVQNERFDVIMHPVMRRLIAIKWKIYGKRGAIMDLALNLVYTILWTVESVTMPKYGYELFLPLKENIWRLIISGIIILFTLMEIKKQVTKTIIARRELVKWRESRAEQLQQDKEYCHPRWRQEEKYLKSEIDAVKSLSLVSTSDWWIYFDWACLFLILAAIAAKSLSFELDAKHNHKTAIKEFNMYTTIAMLLILWFRMFKYARPFESAGPYVVIFSNVVGDILKWIVLNAAILIPFACAFWIGFGFNSNHPAKGYTEVSSLLYNVFQMMIVGEYEWSNLQAANETMARILCGSFILTAAVITLNLLIALVTNTFERHYENAVANAVMQRARTILLLQTRMGDKELKLYYEFIKSNASPQIIKNKYGRLMANKPEDRANIERVYDDVRQIKSVLSERFGKRYGKGSKSDLEIVRGDLVKVKKSGKDLAKDVQNLKMILYGMGGQPVSPVRKSVEERGSSTEILSDRRVEVSTTFNKEASNYVHKDKNDQRDNKNSSNSNTNNTNNNNNNNNNDNNNTVNNNSVDNDTPNEHQPDFNTTPNQQKQHQNNHPLLSPAFLQSYLNKFTLPKSGKKRNRGRRPSKKRETSCTESSESDEEYVPSPASAPQDKQKSSRKKAFLEKPRKKRDLDKHGKPRRDDNEQWWTADYDEKSTSGSRNNMPLRYLQPSLEPTYIDPQFSNPQINVPIYPSKSNIRHGTSTTQIPYIAPITPYHCSITPVPQSKVYFQTVQPSTVEHFPHGYLTPSEDLNHAFLPLRRISGTSVGQQVTPGYTMMYVPQSGHEPPHSFPGLRRPQSEYSSLVHPETIPVQSLPKDKVYFEDKSVSSSRNEETKPASNLAAKQVVTEVPHTMHDPGKTEAPQSQRTIWIKDDSKDLNV